MRRESTGTYLVTVNGGETVRAFVPRPLPPVPELNLREGLGQPLEAASAALGRLDTVTELLPDATVFVHGYVRKEAVLSSQIEGTQSSLADLMFHEAGGVPGVPSGDVLEDVERRGGVVSRCRASAKRLSACEPPHAGDARQVVGERPRGGHDAR